MPPVSRFCGGNRAGKKQDIIDKLMAFFEKYFGLGIVMKPNEETGEYDFGVEQSVLKVSEDRATYSVNREE